VGGRADMHIEHAVEMRAARQGGRAGGENSRQPKPSARAPAT